MCGAVSAGEWDITPRLSMLETYTDNVLLSSRGEEGDFVSVLTPGVSVRGTGPRLTSDIDYNLQQLFYGDKNELDATNHQLQANSEAVLVEQWLYVDAASRMSQQSVINRGQVARNDRGGNANLRDVTSYELTPRMQHRFGPWADVRMSYSHQVVDQSAAVDELDPLLTDFSSTEEAYLFEVSSGSRFGRFPLRFITDIREVEYDNGTTNEFKTVSGEGSYIWSRRIRFTATGGTESNQFASTSGSTDGM